MSTFRLLAPLCASVLPLASGCGGGGSSPSAPGSPTAPDNPTTPSAPGNPGQPGTPMALSALSGSAQHTTLSGVGGTAGATWPLERRRADAGNGADDALVAKVDAAAGVWLDRGLDADTAYAYRLRCGDGSLVAATSARTGSADVLTTDVPQAAGEATSWPVTPTSGLFLRVRAHKLVPAAASVRVLGSQRFTPVGIDVVVDTPACEGPDTALCVPMPVLRNVTLPIHNNKPGFQRQWTLQGSDKALAERSWSLGRPQ